MFAKKKWTVSEGAIFWIVFFLCFCFRLLYVVTLDISVPIRGDAVAYVQYASNLIEHGVFSKGRGGQPLPDSYWSPGYPVFLAISSVLASFFKVGFYPFALFLQAVMGGGCSFGVCARAFCYAASERFSCRNFNHLKSTPYESWWLYSFRNLVWFFAADRHFFLCKSD